MTKEQEKSIKKLTDIGLQYNVDYIYILQDIKRILEGGQLKEENIFVENYLDY